MIRAVVEPLLRLGIAVHDTALFRRRVADVVVEIRRAQSDERQSFVRPDTFQLSRLMSATVFASG